MSDGLVHCRSTSVVKVFETIKQLFNVIFDIAIALRIGKYNFAHAGAMDTAKFSLSIFRLFRNAKNRKFRQKVVTARAESIFTVNGKMFSLCVCYSVIDLLQFH